MKYSKEEKAMWLEDWKQSGKKAWTYAQENGLIPQTFCSWVKREKHNTPCPGFVEIPVPQKPNTEKPQEILVEKGDITIRIPLSVWIEYPGAILKGLQAVP